ncbi:MAG TPA: YicC/YloC family endoribonuclease [Candidatus Binatia bacterium]|nr:YicC/YloC family endoribonuclease [Candidatus Binatia bacterium]
MRSMTGYGSGSAAFPGGRASIELRTVNHRFLEVRMMLPREFLPWEGEWREVIEARIKRGRIELSLTFSGRSPRPYAVNLNLDLARAYREAITRLQRDLRVKGEFDISFLTSRPELFQVTEKPQPTQAEVQAVRQALHLALSALERQRSREGKFLARDLRTRIAGLERARRAISRRSPVVQGLLREKLRERVTTLLQGVDIDQGRLLQEVAALTQRSDITEELVRLQSHVQALTEALRSHEPVGKRIDFLLQEVQREINTIGAKADDTTIRHLVVAAKEEVEKLREQVQNIE